MTFPKDTQAELDAFYSKHKLGADGSSTAAWKKQNFTTITPDYPLTLAFPPGTPVTKVMGRHHNEAFSALKIKGYKNFLRFKIGRDGDLRIYPVGVKKVIKTWRPNSTGLSGSHQHSKRKRSFSY